jgi:hypothetical protein
MIGSIGRGVQLMQRVDDEAAAAQDGDPLAVAAVELYPSPRSCQAVCLSLRMEQYLADGPVRSRRAHGNQHGGGVEDQFPAPSQQPGSLGYPAGRVARQAGAAFGDGQVETRTGISRSVLMRRSAARDGPY